MTAAQGRPPIPAAPPERFEDLRTLAVAIMRGEAQIPLGTKAREVLAQLLEMTGHPAVLSITSLASYLQVHPSTLTRLARALGYPGFPALQRVLLSASMMAPGEFYTRQAEEAIQAGSSLRKGMTQLCRENQANIDRFIDQFDEAAFETAVKQIMAARRVSIHGIRQFHALSSFLVYGLRMLRPDVSLLDSANLGVAEGLAALGPSDTLISISCSPYSAAVIDTARVAQEIGVQNVAITDLASSPLTGTSKAAILIAHQSSFISNSIGAFMVAGECLINACAAHTPDQVRKTLQKRSEMIQRLGIEV